MFHYDAAGHIASYHQIQQKKRLVCYKCHEQHEQVLKNHRLKYKDGDDPCQKITWGNTNTTSDRTLDSSPESTEHGKQEIFCR